MNETIVKKLRSGMTGAAVLSAVCALLGAVAMFVANGMINDPLTSRDDMMMGVAALIALVAWDVVRMGGFGMFVCAVISVIVELFGKASGKLYSFVMLTGSVFGLIGSLMLSLSSVLKMSSSLSEVSGTGASGSGMMITACVFEIVAAVLVFVSLGVRSHQPAPLVYPQYPGYPQQGYPQQYPQQGYPQQYPQQEYPQQYPQQEYPQQSVPVQSAVDLTKTDNDPNNQQ